MAGLVARVRAFRPNARWYLLSLFLTGISMGMFRLLFNFYALSVGARPALLGQLVGVSNLSAFLAALYAGWLTERLGGKWVLWLRTLLLGGGITLMVAMPQQSGLWLGNVLVGLAQAFSQVAQGPFLLANSGPEERSYLFSYSSGLRMLAFSVGNSLGGYLALWWADWLHVAPQTRPAYAAALLVGAALAWVGGLPLLRLRGADGRVPQCRSSTPLSGVMSLFAEPVRRAQVARLLLPGVFISVGAGLFMPFMNVFYRQVHGSSDAVIGNLFGLGAWMMGLGLFLAPLLAEYTGKVRLVVLTQGLSIPFMGVMGFAPWFPASALAYLVRLLLMNMANPLYDAFVMERAPKPWRGTVAALQSMIWSGGRWLGPVVSGWLQERWGFGPVFGTAMVLYTVAVVLYGVFFLGWGRAWGAALAPEVRPGEERGT